MIKRVVAPGFYEKMSACRPRNTAEKDTLLHSGMGTKTGIDHLYDHSYSQDNAALKACSVQIYIVAPRTLNITLSKRTYATNKRYIKHTWSHLHGPRVLRLPDVMANVYTRGSTRPVLYTRKPLEIPRIFSVVVAYPAIDYLITGRIGQMNSNTKSYSVHAISYQAYREKELVSSYDAEVYSHRIIVQ